MLMASYPEIKEFILEQLFKTDKSKVYEARVSFLDLHRKVLIKLQRDTKLPQHTYPFNTAYKGYRSFVTYCNEIIRGNYRDAVEARFGVEAARGGEVGNGASSLLPSCRPYAFAQLDFHKVDAAGIISIKNPHGEVIDIPVTRWHIGVLALENSAAILGIYISLEMAPTSDCILATIENTLRPEEFSEDDCRIMFVEDGKVVINHIIPALSGTCFAALKVDNAWAHSATEVVNNIIDTTGCTLNFGPVYTWWRRSLIENLIGRITKKGLQRLPSTYGNGVSDTRRNEPEAKAIQYKIMLDEVIAVAYGVVREINEQRTTTLFDSSAVSVLQTYVENENAYLPQHLPKNGNSLRLLMHVEEKTVRGNMKKHVLPYVKSDDCIYRSRVLSSAWHLLGKKIVLFIDRNDVEVAFAVVKETGEQLGSLCPERRWTGVACSWRYRKLLNRSAGKRKYDVTEEDTVSKFENKKNHELAEKYKRRGKKRNTKPSKEALNLANRTKKAKEKKAPKVTDKVLNEMASENVLALSEVAGPNDPLGLNVRPILKFKR